MEKRVMIGWALSVFVLLFLPSVSAQEAVSKALITVTGDAEVKVVPDEVSLILGVETWNKDLAAAKSENDQKVSGIIALANRLKIDDKYIQTDFINIEPRYNEQWERREFIGFFVRKTVSLTLKDVSKFEELLSGVLGAGANYVHGIDFRTSELRKYRDQARALAIKAARDKATELAKELGETIGRPQTIQEGRIGWWSGYNSWWGNRYGGQMMQNTVQNAGPGNAPTSGLALGQIAVNASVTVSFELK